ncbi:MAG: glycosyltransferase family 2 protein [Deltaproteobacteria bacterium]|nr:glycosyltransferase family 2 protein [Deltaproteobacteria bacterium]
MAFVSIVGSCFNEAGNVGELVQRIGQVFAKLPEHTYEIVLADNGSTDGTDEELRKLAQENPHVRVILNARNFGHIRSPTHAMLQARGDAVINMATDLEDPPELIADLIAEWQKGAKVVAAVKRKTSDSWALTVARRIFYGIIGRISEVRLIPNFTGFGLYDRVVVERVRLIDDPYPYMRGLISEIGFPPKLVQFDKPPRKRGITKHNFLTLYDFAMLGIVKHSVAPLRLATLCALVLSVFSLFVGLGYLVAKLMWWDQFQLGLAPLLIGVFFFSSVQLFFIGMLGEYVNSIHTHVRRLPLVTERERLNFKEDAGGRAPGKGD